MTIHDLKGKAVAFAASGGLDSCTSTRWMADHGVTVVCITADLGQPDEEDPAQIRDRMLACGASDWVMLDLKAPVAESGLEVIQSQAAYEGRYWNTTAAARHVIVRGMIAEMKKRGLSILSHGCTGRGNDQMRFQFVTNMLAPEFEVYAPWRDQTFLDSFGGRSQMIAYCRERGLPVKASEQAPYSTDSNLLGLTHEAGRLEELKTPASFVEPEMGRRPQDAPDEPEIVTIRFEKGRPVAINGKQVDLVGAFLEANAIGGKHAVGIGTHVVENRFVGVKSRGVYEAPGMELLGTAYGYLLQLVLDRRARELFDQLSLYIAKQLYQGYGFDLGTQMARQAIGSINRLATGTIAVAAYKGRVDFVSATDAPHSLYSEENASMEAMGSFHHGDSEGMARVLGVSARALAVAGQIDLNQATPMGDSWG